MKSIPSVELWPARYTAHTIDELERIRHRLAQAQQDEQAALRKLGELSELSRRQKVALDRTLLEVRETQQRARAAYEALKLTLWNVYASSADRKSKTAALAGEPSPAAASRRGSS